MGIVFWSVSAAAGGQPQARVCSDDGRDAAVLEVVLQDLLARPGVVVLPEGAAKQILFSTESRSKEKVQVRASDVLEGFLNSTLAEASGEKAFFAKLSQERSKLVHEAAKELARRMNAQDDVKPFVPKDKRMKAYGKKEEKAYRPKNFADLGPQVFHVSPPGYSRDRQLAIVLVDFGWSGNFHAALGRYVLVKKDGRWIVLRASLYFFV